jgi:Lipocalin-like domain
VLRAPRVARLPVYILYAGYLRMGEHMKTFVGQSAKFLSAGTVLASLMLLPVTDGWTQQKATDAKQQIVGVWTLVADINTGKDGVKKSGAAFGPNPSGQIIFTSNGRYSSLNLRPDLPKFASGNRMQGTADENKAVVQGSIASFGAYSVSPDGKVLTMKIEGSTWPSWIGTEQKRNLTVSGDELKYTVAASIGGTSELTYKRVK